MRIAELQAAVKNSGSRIEVLSEKERRIIEARIGGKDGRVKTLAEAASFFGVSRETIRLIEDGAVLKLRSAA
jgi:DNA-directed RNA polymerase sigma subunit (sigma70/sigma32)